jgi:adenylate cyclase
VVVASVYVLGGLDWLELKTLDLRFLYANPITESDALVLIDIDDESLTLISRWPWPRDIQAGLIEILHQAGVRRILYDIELSEPEFVRSVGPPQADILTGPDRLDIAADQVATAYPDHELRLAIADASPVYLAFHYQQVPTGPSGESALAAQVWRWFGDHPDLWDEPPPVQFEQVFAAVVDGDPGRYEETVQALRSVLNYAATTRTPILPGHTVEPVAPPVPGLTPVYFQHARAAARCGFVVFEPDPDGIMRRTPLLVRHEDVVLPQLAMAVAFDELRLRPADVQARPGRLTLRSPRLSRPLTIQLDDRGRALVPWVPRRQWTEQFGPQVPMGAVWQIYDRRLKTRQNQELIRDTLSALLEAEDGEPWRTYHADLSRRLELDGELRLARYRDDAEAARQVSDWIRQYDDLLGADEPALRAALEERPVAAGLRAGRATPDTEVRRYSRYAASLDTLRRAFAANDAYREEIDDLLTRLRERVAGKIGLIGYTATALADMTPIPTSARAPGVIAHANLLSGLLTGQTVCWTPGWLNALLTLAVGGLATLVSVRRRPRSAAAIAAIIAVAYVALAAWLGFRVWTCWIALTPAVGAAVASYVTVLLYRYVFLERESRQLATALGQYTSATLARKMAEDAELCRRAETREVTAMFTDLAGFTSISERIGAQRTQRVLNATLGRFSEVILRQEGMINKFIGDGIFAFWNPVIYPQPDHARRACQTAIDLHAALRDLVGEQTRTGGDDAFEQLVLRIGLATGHAVVGPCGSEQKYDYTCIGDSVNVAARLESANKFYGTRILVSGLTREAVGDSFAFRALGGVQVKGKTQAVPIYELLGEAGQVPPDLLEYAQRFDQAVTAFQRRDWAQALAVLETCLSHRPDDLAAGHYLEAARRYQIQPPPADWTGALELAEK